MQFLSSYDSIRLALYEVIAQRSRNFDTYVRWDMAQSLSLCGSIKLIQDDVTQH